MIFMQNTSPIWYCPDRTLAPRASTVGSPHASVEVLCGVSGMPDVPSRLGARPIVSKAYRARLLHAQRVLISERTVLLTAPHLPYGARLI